MDKAEGDAYLERVKEDPDGDGEREVEAIKFVVMSLEPLVASRLIGVPEQVHALVVEQVANEISTYFREQYPDLSGDLTALRAKGAEVRRKVVEYLVACERLDKGDSWDEAEKVLRDAAGNKRGGLAEALAKKEPLND